MLTTSSYLSEAHNTLQRIRTKSTDIVLQERYGNSNTYSGFFDNDVLDEEDIAETKDKFKTNPGEKILIRLDKIKWVENNSLGLLTLTDQRIFYQPQFYDIVQTKKNLEINLDSVNSIGHWLVSAISGVELYVGGNNVRVEFTSNVPLKMHKFWRALKHTNKNWKILKDR